MRTAYHYNLINTETNKIEHENLNRTQAARILHVTESYMPALAAKSEPFKGYIIVPILVEFSTRMVINNSGNMCTLPSELIDRWNDMFNAAALIRSGQGHIRRKFVNGHYVKYTAVIM